MADGTVMPYPKFTGLDDNGDPVTNGLLDSFIAGTTTRIATFSDVALTIANANPVVLDAAGRATVFLVPGTSYKFTLKTAAGVVVWTQDNIAAVPTSQQTVDVVGTVGEAIPAGASVYLSDGTAGKAAGWWYLTDSDFTYSSTFPAQVGIAVAAIPSGAQGAIRTAGQISITGASLVLGALYYAGPTPGVMVTAAPTPNARVIGQAIGVTTIVLSSVGGSAGVQPTSIDNFTNDFRLTLVSGSPISTPDLAGGTTVYLSPYKGNRIALYYQGRWTLVASPEVSLSLAGLTATQPYDVFAAYDGTNVVLNAVAWTNDTTRVANAVQDGVLVRGSNGNQRYIATVRMVTTGSCDDTLLRRFLYNHYNRLRKPLLRVETTGTWVGAATGTPRQLNNSALNQVEFVLGYSETPIRVSANCIVNLSAGAAVSIGVALDAIGGGSYATLGGSILAATGAYVPLLATGEVYVAVGKHTFIVYEQSQTAVTTNYYGSTFGSFFSGYAPGIAAVIEM